MIFWQGKAFLVPFNIPKLIRWLARARLHLTHRNKTALALSALVSVYHWEVSSPLMLAQHETPLLHLRCQPFLQPQMHLCLRWAIQEGRTSSTSCWTMSTRKVGGERVRGVVVRSKKRLYTRTARHSLTQRLHFSDVSGLATVLLWPILLKHPIASPFSHRHHSYSKKSKLTQSDHRAL